MLVKWAQQAPLDPKETLGLLELLVPQDQLVASDKLVLLAPRETKAHPDLPARQELMDQVDHQD